MPNGALLEVFHLRADGEVDHHVPAIDRLDLATPKDVVINEVAAVHALHLAAPGRLLLHQLRRIVVVIATIVCPCQHGWHQGPLDGWGGRALLLQPAPPRSVRGGDGGGGDS